MRRRYFNKTLITSVAGFSLPQNLVSKSSNSKKLGIALVGLGSYSSKALGPALLETKKCELKVPEVTKLREIKWKRKDGFLLIVIQNQNTATVMKMNCGQTLSWRWTVRRNLATTIKLGWRLFWMM